MGWIFSIQFLIIGSNNGDPLYFIAAGLFAIAGTIGIKEFL